MALVFGIIVLSFILLYEVLALPKKLIRRWFMIAQNTCVKQYGFIRIFVRTCCRLRPSFNYILISGSVVEGKQNLCWAKAYTSDEQTWMEEIQVHIKKTILTACKTNYLFGLRHFSVSIYRSYLTTIINYVWSVCWEYIILLANKEKQ